MRSAVFSAAAAVLLGSPVAAEEWHIGEAIKACVSSHLDPFMANFSTGSETCPYECANCLTDPINCLVTCTNKASACGCAKAIPLAIDTVAVCCEQVWDILQDACVSGLRGLGETVVKQISNICESSDEDLAAVMPDGPGSLLVKTRTAVEEGTTALLAGLQAAAERHPGAGALLELQPQRVEVEEQSAGGYVAGHSMGSACLGMLEAIESEHAENAGEDEEMPDLRTAALQIAGRAAGVLGRELPALEDKVHKAMVVNWSEEGPGMDSQDICEVILRHHDSL